MIVVVRASSSTVAVLTAAAALFVVAHAGPRIVGIATLISRGAARDAARSRSRESNPTVVPVAVVVATAADDATLSSCVSRACNDPLFAGRDELERVGALSREGRRREEEDITPDLDGRTRRRFNRGISLSQNEEHTTDHEHSVAHYARRRVRPVFAVVARGGRGGTIQGYTEIRDVCRRALITTAIAHGDCRAPTKRSQSLIDRRTMV